MSRKREVKCLSCGKKCKEPHHHWLRLVDRTALTPKPGPYHEKCCPMCRAAVKGMARGIAALPLKIYGRSFIADAFEGIREAVSRDLAAIVDREITGAPTGKVVGFLPTPEASDFYQQAADAFGMTREEAFVRILDAMTTETPLGKRRRATREFCAYLRDGITRQQQEGSTGGYLVPPEFAAAFDRAYNARALASIFQIPVTMIGASGSQTFTSARQAGKTRTTNAALRNAVNTISARDTRTCGGCGREYRVGSEGGQTPCPYCSGAPASRASDCKRPLQQGPPKPEERSLNPCAR